MINNNNLKNNKPDKAGLITDGVIKKGGINPAPTTPKPKVTPIGQGKSQSRTNKK